MSKIAIVVYRCDFCKIESEFIPENRTPLGWSEYQEGVVRDSDGFLLVPFTAIWHFCCDAHKQEWLETHQPHILESKKI